MSINSVVVVNITRETKLPSQKGFGTPAILSNEAAAFTNLVTTFSSDTALAELVELGVGTGSDLYKAVRALVSQNPKPEKIKVIKQTALVAQVSKISIKDLDNNKDYIVTQNGVDHKITSGLAATNEEILDALELIVPNSEVVGTDLVVTAPVAGEGISLSVSANLDLVHTTPNNGPVEDLIKARDFDDDWYFLGTTTHTKLQTKLIASYVETQVKLFAYQTNDAESKELANSVDVDSTLKIIKDKNYDRSFGVWTDKLDEYKQLGWIGRQSTKIPGQSNWKFKTVKAASVDKFSGQHLKNIQDKNGNVYVHIAGIDMFQEGVVASGEFIDIMIGTDWIQARIQERVFGLLAKEEKVPYSDGGIETVGLQIESVLGQAVTNQILLGDENLDADGNGMGPVVTLPTRASSDPSDVANRILRNVKFKGFYAGAVNKVYIDGTLSI